ncbi:MAG: hypothetical protein ACERKZ_05865 [Lachnotalea sp.]
MKRKYIMDFKQMWMRFKIGDVDYTILFHYSIFKGVYDVEVYCGNPKIQKKEIEIKDVYPPFKRVMKERWAYLKRNIKWNLSQLFR